MDLYLVQPLFFLPLFQFLWLQGQQPVWDWRKGQQNFWRKPPWPSEVFPSLCMARPASQTGLPAGSFSGFVCIAFVEWNHSVTLADVFYQVIDRFHIVALVTQKGTLPKRQDGIGGEAVIGPVRRQRPHNVEPAVASDKPIVVQIISQIRNLRKALAFYDDERADHRFFWKAPPPGCRSGQRKVQSSKQLIVKRSGALECEQRYIPNNFLSVDCGQPLSG